MITLNETHHGAIVLGFFKALTEKGDKSGGRQVFLRAVQLYGEERGRRMSLRALRDKNPLDLISYFAYSEWTPTPGFFDLTMSPGSGLVDEQVFRCPWAGVFREAGCPECGRAYCQEIDCAILRGFQPSLVLEVTQTQHDTDRCQFYFRGKEVREDVFQQADLRLLQAGSPVALPFHYHCGHVWTVFCRVTEDVYGNTERERQVRQEFEENFGYEAVRILDAYRQVDFNRLPREEDFRSFPVELERSGLFGDTDLFEKEKTHDQNQTGV